MMAKQKTCFVIQGFGQKTDLSTGRTLNLDASYEVLKAAVTDAGLQCVRADEIIHSGSIEQEMYRWLYSADLVIADLSTYNFNAGYVLGVRYALRPRSTLIVAEDQFKSPFDTGHIAIRRYKHLGEDVGVREARRLEEELSAAITHIMREGGTDSPVYVFLGLQPPREGRAAPVQLCRPMLFQPQPSQTAMPRNCLIRPLN